MNAEEYNKYCANEMHRQINQSRAILYYGVADIWVNVIKYLKGVSNV